MIAGGYTKLFGSLIGSTLWRQDNKNLKLVWITMLAMANKHGEVMTSIPGLADFAKVTLAECLECLNILKSPDEYSRTPDQEGRRIEDIPGGWRILNFLKYRDTMDEDDRKAYFREKQRQYRSNKKCNSTSPSTKPSDSATGTPTSSAAPPSPSGPSQPSSSTRTRRSAKASKSPSSDNGYPTGSTAEPSPEPVNPSVPTTDAIHPELE